MRTTLKLLTVALVLCTVFAAPIVAEQAQPWFDMVNCAFCKNLGTHAELMKQMQWNHYDLSNGIVSVTTVGAASMPEYKTVCSLMDETGKRLAAGEKLQLCPACQMYSGLMTQGMKIERVYTETGSLQVSQATDPKVVEGIHTWAAKTREAMAEMAKAEPMPAK